MSASARARWPSLALAAAVFAATLALAALTARAQGSPTPGGTVPSVLGLSLGEPSAFRRAGHSDLYRSVIRAEVTATDTPTRLSLADGEAGAGRRRGHLVGGTSILEAPLWAAADGGPYRSLDAAAPPPLQQWRQPVARATAKIRLRQVAPDARALRSHHKLLLVTLTAAGP